MLLQGILIEPCFIFWKKQTEFSSKSENFVITLAEVINLLYNVIYNAKK